MHVMQVFMYACVYVCMHVCMHACMYVCTYVCMYLCMYVCVYVCMLGELLRAWSSLTPAPMGSPAPSADALLQGFWGTGPRTPTRGDGGRWIRTNAIQPPPRPPFPARFKLPDDHLLQDESLAARRIREGFSSGGPRAKACTGGPPLVTPKGPLGVCPPAGHAAAGERDGEKEGERKRRKTGRTAGQSPEGMGF